jgi:isoleucyl-tRNA synthetase
MDFFGEGQLNIPETEKRVIAFWEQEKIFEKSLERTKNGIPYTFYDGPPFATGLPHYGHILASTIKDLIPRYQTMKGHFVRRRWGWDCHGLPIEEIVERKLKISGKKQIEEIGIKKFNDTCADQVLTFAEEWGKMVRRVGRWIEFDNAYKTMDRDFMESVWWAFKTLYDKGLIYEGRKVLMYCPRCETPVSNFEIAMDNSYKDVTEEAVTIKCVLKAGQQIKGKEIPANTAILAWTTTPWTLPGNVALAVGEQIVYWLVSQEENHIIVSEDYGMKEGWKPLETYKGSDLVGLSYLPLYEVKEMQTDTAYKVYAADFVQTGEGTGIVHTAVVYGEDDYALGLKVGLPVVPLLDSKGLFNDLAPAFLRGTYFKDTEKEIKADLEMRGLLFKKEAHTHSYPHCWRCSTALYYNAIPAWFVNVQKIKADLIRTNEGISWYPDHLKYGRYAKSVEAAPDWNISRNRYWGNPVPVWKCDACKAVKVIGSIKELGLQRNEVILMRHGESENNILDILSAYKASDPYGLTDAGKKETEEAAQRLGTIDIIYASDVRRAKETAEIVQKITGAELVFDERLREYDMGVWSGKTDKEFQREWSFLTRTQRTPEGAEDYGTIKSRVVGAVEEINQKHEGKRILIVSHGDPVRIIKLQYGSDIGNPPHATPIPVDVSIKDLHRPRIDELTLPCDTCKAPMHRVPEIFDSWIEAGSMPFAEYHYPFENKELFESRFPGQFVAEYIPQTRAWFYVMHIIAYGIFGKIPFEHAVTTGTILAEDGTKMSKSKNNFPDPWKMIEQYGVDAIRFNLMASAVMHGDDVNFSYREIENVYRKVMLIFANTYKYFATYAREEGWTDARMTGPEQVLDTWITVSTNALVNEVTTSFDAYDTTSAMRAITSYIDDLSTWYVRRSRGRKDAAFFSTLYNALERTARVLAPVAPHLAEAVYWGLKEFGGIKEESVHLAKWPEAGTASPEEEKLVEHMHLIREAASIGQGIRKKENIALRQPLARYSVSFKDKEGKAIIVDPSLLAVLSEELNIKTHEEKLEGAGLLSATGDSLTITLDPMLTPELKEEGVVRGFEGFVQELRKTKGFKVGELAVLAHQKGTPEFLRMVSAFDTKKTYITAVKEKSLETPTLFDEGEWKGEIDLEKA